MPPKNYCRDKMAVDGGGILVVGGGPAGCAAAITLARAGFKVQLFEKGCAGRDKICGDAMLPDARMALARLGVFGEVKQHATPLSGFTVYAKGNVRFRLPCEFYTLQRTHLDQILRDRAAASGARVLHGASIQDIRVTDGGVTLTDLSGKVYEGACVILATGSDTRLAERLGFTAGADSSVSMRSYAENNLGPDSSILWFAETLRAGFGWGWIFPVPGDLLNVGVFVDRNGAINLAEFFGVFVRCVERLRQVKMKFVSKPHGWVLKKGLSGGRLSAARVLLAGESIHAAYNFTGEGIGTALRSGMLAAEVVVAAGNDYSAQSLARYDRRVREEFSSWHSGFTRAVRIARNRYAFSSLTRLFACSAGLRRAGGRLISGDLNPSRLLSPAGVVDIIMS